MAGLLKNTVVLIFQHIKYLDCMFLSCNVGVSE